MQHCQFLITPRNKAGLATIESEYRMPKAKSNKPALTNVTEAPKAKAPFVHIHAESGVSAKHYAGLSAYLNANRKPNVGVGVQKYGKTVAQLTTRQLATFKAMRGAYANGKPFPQRGFDNAVCACLINAGLIRHVPNTGDKTTTNGVAYLIDGAKPLALAITKAGQTYGQATA